MTSWAAGPGDGDDDGEDQPGEAGEVGEASETGEAGEASQTGEAGEASETGEAGEAQEEGGEAPCLLHRVCPDCGRIAEEREARHCGRCGTPLPPFG